MRTFMRRAYLCLVAWAATAMIVGIGENAGKWSETPGWILRVIGFVLVCTIIVGEGICAWRDRTPG